MTLLRRLLLPLCLLTLTAATALCFPPPKSTPPDADVLKTIGERTDKLTKEIAKLRSLGVAEHLVADADVYLKAAVWVQRHDEFYQKDAAERTLAVLDRGLLRANQLGRGEYPWRYQTGRSVARGFRSNVDGSVQPYAVTLPAEYGKDPAKKWRLDVVLHGRNDALTEVLFLSQFNGEKEAPKELNHIQIDIYGRGNNAYRWAGESDVYEAVENFVAVEQLLGRGPLIDPARRVLRGFSMGGAGTWHIGLQRPDDWCVIGPGAGFTTTRGYIADLPDPLPPEVEACLHIYDAVDYAENAFNVPVVAYSGEKDKQKQAADNIEAKLKPLGIAMTHLIGPDLEHKFPPEWQKKAEEEYAKYVAKGKPAYPKKIRFVTYTLRYPACQWVNLLSLDQHYKRAAVEAEHTDDGFTVKTTNVRALDLAMWPGATRELITVNIDGQKLTTRPYLVGNIDLHVYLEKRDNRWSAVLLDKLRTERLRVPQKIPGLQGPIDDAFTAGFLCVRGTRDPWHEETQKYADASLKRFQAEWSKYMRGELPVKNDEDVTPQDLASKHLILFGDPASNSLIEQALGGLPLKWTRDQITWQGKEYASAEHVPALIYPSPLNTERYVVLNSGHTFHAAQFEQSNAQLYPRLGDFALLKLPKDKKDPLEAEVLKAGLFDDFWRAPAPK
jgi:hypothetical protein